MTPLHSYKISPIGPYVVYAYFVCVNMCTGPLPGKGDEQNWLSMGITVPVHKKPKQIFKIPVPVNEKPDWLSKIPVPVNKNRN